MALGMSRDEYWNGDIFVAFDYIEAEQIRKKRLNEQLWLQGMYICDAVAVAVHNTVGISLAGGKGDKATYPERPYGFEKSQEEKQQEEENEMLRAKLYMQQLVEVGKNWGKKE